VDQQEQGEDGEMFHRGRVSAADCAVQREPSL
jgi:hypothetical protein